MSQHAQPAPDAADCVQQAWEIVRTTEDVVGVGDLSPGRRGPDPHAADAALSAARHALARRLELTSVSRKFRDQAALAALALRAEQTQVALKDALLGLQRRQVESVQDAINGLRGATSAAALVERIPTEVYRMGFSRVLFSRIQNGMWLTCSAFAGADLELASRMVEAGLAHPRQLTRPLLESEMVRRGAPDPGDRPADRPAACIPNSSAVTQTPAMWRHRCSGGARPIGLVHADRHTPTRRGVTEFDRDVLGMFAAGLGLAFERNLMIDRLRAMRQAADEHMRFAGALADDFTLDVMDLGRAGAARHRRPDGWRLRRRGRGRQRRRPTCCDDLTAREAEVLRGIAAGKTNAQIAAIALRDRGHGQVARQAHPAQIGCRQPHRSGRQVPPGPPGPDKRLGGSAVPPLGRCAARRRTPNVDRW